jgi:hypothetical protein
MPTQKAPRRKIIAFLMVTLDGYHQTTDGDLSWHNVDDEFNEFAAAQIDEADTLLFGRKTYEGMAEFWRSPVALEVDAGMSERMNRYPKIVVSRSLASAQWTPSTLISDDAPVQESFERRALIGDERLPHSLRLRHSPGHARHCHTGPRQPVTNTTNRRRPWGAMASYRR